MDLPTYTNIWRIEKRLYKLYDFRLPAPLPITWIGVFAGITVPYVVFLIAVGLPFNHNLVWLYVLPPGVLTWLTTRPVIESKRLPELVSSQLRYIAEPRTWCRMAPFAEKDDILVTARVWHRKPPRARSRKARKSAAVARAGAAVLPAAAEDVLQVHPAETAPQRPARSSRTTAKPARHTTAKPARRTAAKPATRTAAPPLAPAPQAVPLPPAATAPPSPGQVPVPERALAYRPQKPARAQRDAGFSWAPWPHGAEQGPAAPGPDTGHGQEPGQPRPAWMISRHPREAPDARTLEVAHDSGPGGRDLREPNGPMAWPSSEASLLPLIRPVPGPVSFPDAGPFPEPGPFPDAGEIPEADAPPEAGPLPEPGAGDGSARAAGPVRRSLSGLLPGPLRKPDRGPSPAAFTWTPPEPPPAEVPPSEAQAEAPLAEALPAELPSAAEAAGRAAPAGPPRPRERWMLRVQPRPARSPADPADPAGPVAAEQLAPAAAPAADRPAEAHDVPAASAAPQAPAPPPQAPAPVAARFVGAERERRLPSIERALSGPGSRDEMSWRRQVKVVTGGQGPGKRDQEILDRDRVRLPLDGPRRITVLGCTRGAGQTVTTLMTARILAAVRGVAVAALDLNPGATSLAARLTPAASVHALLAEQRGQEPGQTAGRGQGARLDVIAGLPGNGMPGNGAAQALGPDDYERLATLLAERYPLTMIDPAPSGLTRVLSAADQLVLVAPASPDAATSLANTQQWLGAHGYGELAGHAVTVVNGVSRRTMEDVLRAESVARGRCRAIVRVPWDDNLSPVPQAGQLPAPLSPQTRLAYTALAGVLVAGLAAVPRPVSGRNPGEHSD